MTLTDSPTKRDHRTGILPGAAAVLVGVVVAIVTLGKPFLDIPGLVDASAHRVRHLDLQLFNGWVDPVVWYGPWTNTFGNVALFLPVGACLYALGRRTGLFGIGGTMLLSLVLSLGIEATQYVFALGYSDVDDLLCNTIGGTLASLAMSRLSAPARTTVIRRLGAAAACVLVVLICAVLAGVVRAHV